jgi:hypothetical protein
LCVARRLSRRDLDVFRLGTAMTAGEYSHTLTPCRTVAGLLQNRDRAEIGSCEAPGQR